MYMTIEKDSYKTIKNSAEGLFKDKGSKFIALGYSVSNEKEIKTIIKEVKKKYHDARHHCYAYRLGLTDGAYRMNDDGEPSGTAGKPIYGQILSYGLSDVLIVVVRYFGGTLLGTSGLINAYKSAAQDLIDNSSLVERTIKKQLQIIFAYDLLNIVMKLVKDEELDIVSQDFTDRCKIVLDIRVSNFDEVKGKLESIYGIDVKII